MQFEAGASRSRMKAPSAGPGAVGLQDLMAVMRLPRLAAGAPPFCPCIPTMMKRVDSGHPSRPPAASYSYCVFSHLCRRYFRRQFFATFGVPRRSAISCN